MAATIRLLEELRFDPPRPVEVEHGGRWWPGTQAAWRLCDDGRGWRVEAQYVVQHEWGRGQHMPTLPPSRWRPGRPQHDGTQPSW